MSNKNLEFLGEILEPLDFNKTFKERQNHIEHLLCRFLNMKTIVAFIGAGTSIPLGYPSWKTFAEDIFKLLNISLSSSKNGDCLAVNYFTAKDDDNTLQTEPFKEVFRDTPDEFLFRYAHLLQKIIKQDYTDEIEIREVSKKYNDPKHKVDFERFKAYLGEKKSKEIDFQTIFSECERLLCSDKEWQTHKQSKFFRILVKSYFQIKRVYATLLKKEQLAQKEWNPYLALLDLPIKKFATFNYDLEIERALLFKKKILPDVYKDENTCEQIIKKSEEKSFSQTKKYCDELADFSLSRYEDSYDAVFHCHGRIDDVKNCVVSEEDYQKWYLREDKEEFTPFRQTLEITLDSGPILFMGFSLNDPDFMRILRSNTANRPIDKTRNPLFCLLHVMENDIEDEAEVKNNNTAYKYKNQQELEDECTMLYIKYGLHVIPIKVKDWNQRKLADGTTEAIEPTCHKLIKLNENWREWWKGIVQKPMFRKFQMKSAELYFHYEFKISKDKRIAEFDTNLHDELDVSLGFNEIIASNVNGESKPKEIKDYFASHLAVVVGGGGTGKSWSVQHYLKEKAKVKDNQNKKKYKIFFWSSYYANDVLTGIDRLIEFFISSEVMKQNTKKDKFDFLKDILDENEDAIIVFDGIEKLLKPNKENTEGESVNPEVQTFLKILTNKKVKSRIIITTRLFPKDIFFNLEEVIKCEVDYKEKYDLLEIKSKIKKEKILSAPKCWSKQLTDKNYLSMNSGYLANYFENQESKFFSYFCSLFDGHVFAISIMKGILEDLEAGGNDNENRTKNLLAKVVNTPIELRVNRVIQEAIAHLDKDTSSLEVFKNFIERISLFMHPIRKEVAQVCFKQIKVTETKSINLTTLLRKLTDKNLVQIVRIKDINYYVVHPLIRSYIFETLHESRFSSLPGLQLPGFTSSKEVVDPGNKKGKEVSLDLFRDLCERAKEIVIQPNIKDKNRFISSDMCRGAFSIIRSRFCSNTVVRWGNYTEYIRNLLLLFDTAKHVSTEHWDFNEPTQSGFDLCSNEYAPLYSDELAWVYNEIGIASFSMGYVLNAAAILGEGFEINRLIDKEFDGRYTFQSNINKGAVNLYYGKLDTSMNYLNKAVEVANKLKNNSLIGRVTGYIAVVKYLRGNLEEANIEFNSTYEILDDNLRAKSIYMNMHGELLLKLGKYPEALEKIEQSRHIAESIYYQDLVAYAKLSKANYYVHIGDHIKAQVEFQHVLQIAKDKHLRRLEAGTLSGMSRLAEKLGDYSSAISRAVEALKIANEYSLRLHQTLSLFVLGTALINGHTHKDLGISCLKTANAMALKQEYFLRANEVQEELLKLNINLDIGKFDTT